MLNFNTTIPAIAVAVLGFTAGAWLFTSLLKEPKPPAPVARTISPETEATKKAAKPVRQPNDQG